MPGPTLTLPELADELGRKTDWLMRNWRQQVHIKKIPPPLTDTQPFVWSRAQVYAYLDHGLPRELQAAAAAQRAAYAAMTETPLISSHTTDVAAWEGHLNRRFAGQ